MIVHRVHQLAFQEWFGLPRAEARVLAALFSDAGQTCAQDILAAVAEIHRASVQPLICEVRKAMEAEAIDTLPGAGYRLTDQGVAECRAALASFADEMRVA